MQLRMPKSIRARARAMGAPVEQDLKLFILAKLNGQIPRRKDKPCGFGRFGQPLCQMQIDLRMRHYRLTGHADPLLIYQQTDEWLTINALASHEDIFHGNENAWCHAWHHTIDWELNEHHLEALVRQFGPLT